MNGAKKSQPVLRKIRSSKLFVLTVINLAVFSECILSKNRFCANARLLKPSALADAYLYALIIPVLPFALVERVRLHEDDVQRWIGILLAAYGAGLLVASRESSSFLSFVPRCFVLLMMLDFSNRSMARGSG